MKYTRKTVCVQVNKSTINEALCVQLTALLKLIIFIKISYIKIILLMGYREACLLKCLAVWGSGFGSPEPT